ncbi:MAG: 2,3,4,5-tetrahydropyridine-2,6-dicarboxylate N-succinyltransferase [Holosporaceae bacterium]|nr:2,3,4,5-tetrahydropyridine-2,6-dicarboxylate N-succinyltransferase [Holosporaceae bacterium]
MARSLTQNREKNKICTLLEEEINALWNREHGDTSCVMEALKLLNLGQIRVAEKVQDKWVVHKYLQKAILLFFRQSQSQLMPGELCSYFDKIPLKTHGWSDADFATAGFRAVPGCFIRYGAYVAASAVIMPSIINIGSFIDENSMIDSNVLVGSCAQIGKNCHISDGVSIGGVLEPLCASPVIIEDNCFLGIKSAVAEGVLIERGSVLAAGTILTSSTKIIHRETGEISYGRIPAYSVVVPGTYPASSGGDIHLGCAIIVKRVNEQTRKKTSINALLRL